MSGLDDSKLCSGVDKISSDNKTFTSYAQKVDGNNKGGASCENNNNGDSDTIPSSNDNATSTSNIKSTTAFTFLPPKSEASVIKTRSSNTNDSIFHFGRLAITLPDDNDDILFQDPPAKKDCPICMLPMPYAPGSCGVRTTYMQCCGKVFCYGCAMAESQEMDKGNIKGLCSFCREPINVCIEDSLERFNKRMKLKDGDAFYQLGIRYCRGDSGLRKDSAKALELWKQGAELGSIAAHYQLGEVYARGGEGVERDNQNAFHHWEAAAIGGHERARYYLGLLEACNDYMDRAMKHYMIAARAGYDEALKKVGEGYKEGHVTKYEYASTLRTYQDSLDVMKSEQRTRALDEK